jgi:PKD repeat protein
MKNSFFRLDILIAAAGAALAAACGVHQTEAPGLTGPSTFAQSVVVEASPDRITLDGASKSTVTVRVFKSTGEPKSGVTLRLDMVVGGQLQDYGTLSARSATTGNDGTVQVIYTAPPPPAAPANSMVATVSVRAIPVGDNAQTAIGTSADIRLMPSGVITPPAGAPTASFTYGPTPVNVNVPVTFDGTSSTPGTNAVQITKYDWNFGDGQTGSGPRPIHTFMSAGTFNVMLTVTNDGGVTNVTTQQVTVGATDPFTGDWVISPLGPVVNQQILFNADQVQTSPGHQVTQFNWTFGDGSGGTGFQTTHAYTQAGTYNVVLSVVDDLGRKKVFAAKPIGVGTGAPVPIITFSPGSPTAGTSVSFDSTGTTTSNGATVVSYQWNFGDGSAGSALANPAHTFTVKGTYTVRLTVIDSQGRAGSGSTTVLVN